MKCSYTLFNTTTENNNNKLFYEAFFKHKVTGTAQIFAHLRLRQVRHTKTIKSKLIIEEFHLQTFIKQKG